jgi:hypothetical protein
MKNIIKLIGFTALAAVIGFSMIACDSGGGGGGGSRRNPTPTPSNTRDPVTYAGTANGVTYTLKIEAGTTGGSQNVLIYEDSSRAVLTPAKDDEYTLTADGKTSKGTVSSFTGGVLTLAPSEAEDPEEGDEPFTVTVSGNGITAMSGTITWDDGDTEEAPAVLAPTKSITITGISGTGAPTGNIEVMISSSTDGDNESALVARGEGTISGGSITVVLFNYSDWNTAYTGSGSYYVSIWEDDTQSYWTTKEKKSITANTTIPWANQWDKWM